MASRRILSSILRLSSRRSAASKCPMLSTPPSLSSTRGSASAYGYLLNRKSEYATSSVKPPPSSESPKYDGKKVTVDEFPEKGSTGQVCRLNGNIADVRFEDGLPEIGTALRVLDDDDDSIPAAADLEVVDHLNESIVRAYSVDGTKGLVLGQSALSTGVPISQSTRKVELAYHSDGDDVDREHMEQELEDFEQEDVEQEDLVQVYVKARKYLLEKHWLEYKLSRTEKELPPKLFNSWTLLNGSVGTVRRLAGRVVDVGFDRKFQLGTTYLEVLPATLEVLPESPLLMQVCSVVCISGDEIIVRAVAMNGTEGLVVGEKVFGFPTPKPLYEDEIHEVERKLDEMSELKEFEMEVTSIQEKVRLMKQKKKEAEVKTELVADGEMIVQMSPERQRRMEPQGERFSRRPRCHDRIRYLDRTKNMWF